jgi:hypothetical protein
MHHGVAHDDRITQSNASLQTLVEPECSSLKSCAMAMKFTIDATDKVYFPMKDSDMDDSLNTENWLMVQRNDCCELSDPLEPWGDKTGMLFIWGHGSAQDDIKHLIRGKLGTGGRSAREVAADIAAMGFPTGPDNEICVWSCFSGVVGGFAQLLTLYLIRHGYTGKKVWGSKFLTGTNVSDRLQVFPTRDSAKRDAQSSDVTFYIGR